MFASFRNSPLWGYFNKTAPKPTTPRDENIADDKTKVSESLLFSKNRQNTLSVASAKSIEKKLKTSPLPSREHIVVTGFGISGQQTGDGILSIINKSTRF